MTRGLKVVVFLISHLNYIANTEYEVLSKCVQVQVLRVSILPCNKVSQSNYHTWIEIHISSMTLYAQSVLWRYLYPRHTWRYDYFRTFLIGCVLVSRFDQFTTCSRIYFVFWRGSHKYRRFCDIRAGAKGSWIIYSGHGRDSYLWRAPTYTFLVKVIKLQSLFTSVVTKVPLFILCIHQRFVDNDWSHFHIIQIKCISLGSSWRIRFPNRSLKR